MKNKMTSDLTKIYLFKFFDDFVLIYPFYTLMFVDSGVAPAQLGVLIGVWSFTVLLMEIPSGALADKYSRKHMLAVAEIIRALGCVIWLLFPTFWGFVAGFVLWGIKSSFVSGTYQALVYDLLADHGREKEYAKIIGRAKTLSYLAIVLAAGGAALAIPAGYSLVIVLSIVAMIIAAVIVLLVSPAKKQQSTREREYLAILKSGVRYALHHSTILRLILFIAIIHSLGGAIDEYFPIFGSLTGISKSGIALYIGVMGVMQATASFFAHKFENLPLRIFYVSLTVGGLLFFWAALALNIGSLVALVVFSGLYTASTIVIESKFQHVIPSDTRATISSVQGFITEIGMLAVFLGFGFLSQVYGFARGFQIFGLVVIGVGLLYIGSSLVKREPKAAQ